MVLAFGNGRQDNQELICNCSLLWFRNFKCFCQEKFKRQSWVFSFVTPQQAPLSVSLWVCVVGKPENSEIHSLLCYFKHVFQTCISLHFDFLCLYRVRPGTFTNTSNSVLHIILIPNGQRASTLPAASADSLSVLISELQRTQYDCSAFMLLWGRNLQVHPGCSVTL